MIYIKLIGKYAFIFYILLQKTFCNMDEYLKIYLYFDWIFGIILIVFFIVILRT